MEDRDVTRSDEDEEASVRDKDWDRETKAPDEAVREAAEVGLEDDDAVVRREEYGTRPA